MTDEGIVIPTLSPVEMESLKSTLALSGDKWVAVRNEFSKAIEHFASRPSPNYKEACFCANEALDKVAKVLLSDESKTLGGWAKWASKHSDRVPPQLKDKVNSIYAVRGGHIQHGNSDTLDAPFTQWYLVSCSALINWMIQLDS
jgi:hypothetical protein